MFLQQLAYVHHTTRASTFRLLLPEIIILTENEEVTLSRQLHPRKSLSTHVSVGYS